MSEKHGRMVDKSFRIEFDDLDSENAFGTELKSRHEIVDCEDPRVLLVSRMFTSDGHLHRIQKNRTVFSGCLLFLRIEGVATTNHKIERIFGLPGIDLLET